MYRTFVWQNFWRLALLLVCYFAQQVNFQLLKTGISLILCSKEKKLLHENWIFWHQSYHYNKNCFFNWDCISANKFSTYTSQTSWGFFFFLSWHVEQHFEVISCLVRYIHVRLYWTLIFLEYFFGLQLMTRPVLYGLKSPFFMDIFLYTCRPIGILL